MNSRRTFEKNFAKLTFSEVANAKANDGVEINIEMHSSRSVIEAAIGENQSTPVTTKRSKSGQIYIVVKVGCHKTL